MSMIGWDIEPEEDVVEDPGLRGRLFFFRFIIIGMMALLLMRVYWIQQERGDEFQKLSEDNQFATLSIDPPRGEVFDRMGRALAINEPSFDVTITPAFLPDDEQERMRVFQRLSLLTGMPVTNTVQQRALAQQADPSLISMYSRLAQLYNAPVDETLDNANVIPELTDSIAEIYETYSFAQYLPAVVTTSVPITLAYRIEQESAYLPGVRIIPTPIRHYPSGGFTSHIIGFMGPLPNENWLDLGYDRDDRVGWSGLEVSMEEELAGLKGERRIEVDWTGREIRQIGETREPIAGLNLHLTIDLELQREVYSITQKYMEKERSEPRIDYITGERTLPEIEQASVVVLNVNTGEVLAMVNIPTFDNNRFATEVPVDYYLGLERNDYQPLLNHAIAGTYPPGSTFKIVTAAAALQSGIISPNRLLEAPGRIVIPNRFAPEDPGRSQEFVCWALRGTLEGSHGMVNMYSALTESCDIYFYKVTGGYDQDGEVVEGVGIERLKRYGEQFGFGRTQGIELPIEAAGIMPDADYKALNYGEPWSTGDSYNAAIGQGYITSTPLQVTQMAAIIANGGFLYRPRLVHHMTDENGNVVVRNNDGRLIVVIREEDGDIRYEDRQGNPVDAFEVGVPVQFDENGNYLFQPEVLNAVDVDREWLDVIAQGMRMVNMEEGTGAAWVDWLDEFGITSAGKTGTAEYCDNIAIERGWCGISDIENRVVLPTHSWYTGYAPYENPEIAVAAFVFNGDEGSQLSAPIVRDVMAAYFNVDNYAPQVEEGTEAEPGSPAPDGAGDTVPVPNPEDNTN